MIPIWVLSPRPLRSWTGLYFGQGIARLETNPVSADTEVRRRWGPVACFSSSQAPARISAVTQEKEGA
jgi:hypothetical protein